MTQARLRGRCHRGIFPFPVATTYGSVRLQLLADAEKVVKLLATNKKGLRIEQINEQLGTATKALARPILKLLAEGKIKKTGEKRGTLYFPV